MAQSKPVRARPLSPHLSIYKPLVNMVMSIVHRITGAALYLGSLLLAWWLVAAAAGPQTYAIVSGVLASWPGKLVLLGYSWALMHHALGGLRHLYWDTGRGFDLATVDRLSRMTLVGSIGLTLAIWLVAVPAAAYFALTVASDNSPERLIVENDEDYQQTRSFQKIFPEGKYVVLLAEAEDPFTPEALERFEDLERALRAVVIDEHGQHRPMLDRACDRRLVGGHPRRSHQRLRRGDLGRQARPPTPSPPSAPPDEPLRC